MLIKMIRVFLMIVPALFGKVSVVTILGFSLKAMKNLSLLVLTVNEKLGCENIRLVIASLDYVVERATIVTLADFVLGPGDGPDVYCL